MKSDLNLRLSCQQHPGSARLARGWCGLKVKGSFAYVADCTPVDKAFRCYGQGALSLGIPCSQTTDLLPLQLSFKPAHNHSLCWSLSSSFIRLQLCIISSSSVTLFLESRCGTQWWTAFISVLGVLHTHPQRTKWICLTAVNVKSFASPPCTGVFHWKGVLYCSLSECNS